MDKKKLLATLIAATVATPAVYAMSDKEVEARFQKYEAQIKSLQSEVKDMKANGGVVYVQDLEKQNKRNTKQIDDIKARMDSDADKFKMNGFMTAAVSSGSHALDTDYAINDNPNFAGDSKMGLQFNYKLDDKADATVQLVARSRPKGAFGGDDAWGVSAEWAYLGYKLTDDLKVRMGRLRIPFYMYYETLDVGYTYPWVRPPIEMYTNAITSYNGADTLYNFSWGSVNSTLQFFGGAGYGKNPEASDVKLNLQLKDTYGINLTSTLGNWTARAMAATLSIEGDIAIRKLSDIPVAALPFVPGATCNAASGLVPAICNDWTITAPLNDTLDYYTLGGQYDNGNLFVVTELSRLDTANAALFGDSESGYVTAGYRIDKWTPYATLAKSYSTEPTASVLAACTAQGNCTSANYPSTTQSVSFGLRRELTDNMSAKLEWNHFYGLEGSGGFNSDLTAAGDNADPENIYTFALDAVF